MARGLWNNLLQPVGSKTNQVGPRDPPLLCPTKERPYLATAANSGGFKEDTIDYGRDAKEHYYDSTSKSKEKCTP